MMALRRRIFINSAMSVVQTLFTSIILFVLYRFLMDTMGVELLGLWSLILATTSVTQAANMGLTGSVVKFVARYAARQDARSISGIVQTAFVSVAVFIGGLLVLGYPIFRILLGRIVPPDAFPLALRILPFALVSLWLTLASDVFRSALDGHQKIYVRNILLMGGVFFYFLLCLWWVPAYGLLGLAYAQVAQNIAILIFSWFLLKKFSTGLPFLPWRWEKHLFKEMIGYGINFQIISVAAMFFDPITKILLSRFGGLTTVGFYEMANKLILQFRALILSANQALVPAIADMKEKSPGRIKEVYLASFRLLLYLTAPLYSLIIAAMPLISSVWIGRQEPLFCSFGVLLGVGWFFNVLAGPAYVGYLGIGDLRWNVVGHITIGILTIALGFLGGLLYKGTGVVVGWVVSLISGSVLIIFSYNRQHKVSLGTLLPSGHRRILAVCPIVVLLAMEVQNRWGLGLGNSRTGWAIFLLFFILLGPFFWIHPMRGQLSRWIIGDRPAAPRCY